MKHNKKNSRRNFLGMAATTSLLLGSSGLSNRVYDPPSEEISTDKFSCLDYGRSFICNTGEYNSVRLWIESRTTIVDTASGNRAEYLQCGSCKSEDTFAKENLFFKDNYDFLPIFGGDQVLVFRRHVDIRDSYRIIKPMSEMWGGDPVIILIRPKKVEELFTWEEIRDVTAAGIPIVTQAEIYNKDTGLSAIIECPCKTMNISHVKKMYQVDSGPIALPDLTKRYDPEIACLDMAFIAFNTHHFADFVIEAPTPVMEDRKEVARVFHYSKMLTLQSKNRVLALTEF